MLNKPPLEKKWYECPHCGKKLVIYNNVACCSGVFVYCKRCKRQIEIIIK